jgi:hypothetical protein
VRAVQCRSRYRSARAIGERGSRSRRVSSVSFHRRRAATTGPARERRTASRLDGGTSLTIALDGYPLRDPSPATGGREACSSPWTRARSRSGGKDWMKRPARHGARRRPYCPTRPGPQWLRFSPNPSAAKPEPVTALASRARSLRGSRASPAPGSGFAREWPTSRRPPKLTAPRRVQRRKTKTGQKRGRP